MSYLDPSMLVAYYGPEPLSRRVQQVLSSAPSVTLSELAQAEFFAALSLCLRIGDLARTNVDQIANMFLNHLARTFIARFDLPLKTPDALHLAAASFARLQLITADRQLARNARALGIDVALLEA